MRVAQRGAAGCNVTHVFISGVAQWLACWAHNPKVRGSKPHSAKSGNQNEKAVNMGHSKWWVGGGWGWVVVGGVGGGGSRGRRAAGGVAAGPKCVSLSLSLSLTFSFHFHVLEWPVLHHEARHCVRAAKEMDSNSIGLCPQGFESPRCRFLPPHNHCIPEGPWAAKPKAGCRPPARLPRLPSTISINNMLP